MRHRGPRAPSSRFDARQYATVKPCRSGRATVRVSADWARARTHKNRNGDSARSMSAIRPVADLGQATSEVGDMPEGHIIGTNEPRGRTIRLF